MGTGIGFQKLFALVDMYGADYRVVKLALDSVKRKGFLPEGFVVPENAEEFEGWYRQRTE